MSTSSRSSGRLWVQASELGLIQGVQTIIPMCVNMHIVVKAFIKHLGEQTCEIGIIFIDENEF